MFDGVINILKPPGMTSSNVVQDVRRALSIKRVGHTGTLDPGACGVLPILVGRATRLFDYLVDKDKEYIAEFTFGVETDTLDSYGTITEQKEADVLLSDLEQAKNKFIGKISQLAPMYSAVNVDGERLYKAARKGIVVERTPRKANIHYIDIIKQTDKNRFLLQIGCSRGTYFRTLCLDSAHELGTFGYLSFLERTQSGDFTIENAISIAELNEAVMNNELEAHITNVDEALRFLGEIRLETNERALHLLTNGASIAYNGCEENALGLVYYDDTFLGIGEIKYGELHIKTQFSEG
ncbi:MAG: tRNA pseudouridine(55) synthase TruB [Clostridiales bacterium]|nr:tRNA pseudouridine(55) synthase TruB [Clostridiales bacterium]